MLYIANVTSVEGTHFYTRVRLEGQSSVILRDLNAWPTELQELARACVVFEVFFLKKFRERC